jgi:TPP-dependent 2-oxoacid decarboxylase
MGDGLGILVILINNAIYSIKHNIHNNQQYN